MRVSNSVDTWSTPHCRLITLAWSLCAVAACDHTAAAGGHANGDGSPGDMHTIGDAGQGQGGGQIGGGAGGVLGSGGIGATAGTGPSGGVGGASATGGGGGASAAGGGAGASATGGGGGASAAGGGSGGAAATGGGGGTSATGGAAGAAGPRPRFLMLPGVVPTNAASSPPRYEVEISAASDDGTVLVGDSTYVDPATTLYAPIAFYWTEKSGVVPLPAFPGRNTNHVSATTVSGDGTTIVGREWIVKTFPTGGAGSYGGRIFRWPLNGRYELFAPTASLDNNGALDGDIGFVSRDGTSIWGSYQVGPEGMTVGRQFIWTTQGGLSEPRLLPGWPSGGVGSPDDGTDGRAIPVYTPPDDKLFLWSQGSATIAAPPLPGFASCGLRVFSKDGSTIFGECYKDHDTPFDQTIGFAWTAAGGTVAITDQPGYNITFTSVDGIGTGIHSADSTLLRWTKTRGLERLKVPEAFFDGTHGPYWATIEDVTASGNTVYGAINAYPPRGRNGCAIHQPFRWSPTDGFVRLDHLTGWNESSVSTTIPDGSVAVGTSFCGPEGAIGPEVAIWDGHGVRRIADVLTAAGVDLGGATLTSADRIWVNSNSMVMIVGTGKTADRQVRPWIAWLPLRP